MNGRESFHERLALSGHGSFRAPMTASLSRRVRKIASPLRRSLDSAPLASDYPNKLSNFYPRRAIGAPHVIGVIGAASLCFDAFDGAPAALGRRGSRGILGARVKEASRVIKGATSEGTRARGTRHPKQPAKNRPSSYEFKLLETK